MEWDFKRIVGYAAMLAVLAGCSGVALNRGGYYAPVKAQNSPYYREQYRVQSLSPSFITVHKGDTVYSLSRRYNVPIRSMIEVNNLKPPFILSKGARLRLPAPSVHIVQKGDTIYSISRRYNVDMSVQIFDPLEADPPPSGTYRVSDGQNIMTLPADDDAWRAAYTRRFETAHKRVSDFCLAHKMLYVPVRTDDDLIRTLRSALFERKG